MKKYMGKNFIKYALLSTWAITFYFFMSNLGQFSAYTSYVTAILSPVIIGFCMAFVLNILMRLIEEHIFDRFFSTISFLYRKKRGISVILSVLISFVAMVGVLAFIIPQVVSSVSKLYEGLPDYAVGIKQFLEQQLLSLNVESQFLNKVLVSSNDILVKLTTFVAETAYKAIPSLFDGIKGAAAGALTFLLSLVLAVYMLMDKERLIHNMKRVLRLFTKEETNGYVLHVGDTVNNAFHSFVSGQITESIILGILCFFGMTLFGFPYAFLISFIIGITCLIPYFGAFIGSVPAFLIILITSPPKAVWFLLFVIVLQQLEGNIIYPRVVGNSVGLPTIWVSIALIVGGNMFGFLGMILGIPIFASAYLLFREYVIGRELLEEQKQETLEELSKNVKNQRKMEERNQDNL